MAYSGRNQIYEAIIRRMVSEALAQQDEDFRLAHVQSADSELLAYLLRCAAELGHTPWPREIPGGRMIGERFGSWDRALGLAELPPPDGPDRISRFARYQTERTRQQECYRRRKEEKKRSHLKTNSDNTDPVSRIDDDTITDGSTKRGGNP